MAEYKTDICAPADQAPQTTGKYAKCAVCGVQWQIRSFSNADAQACTFCGAPREAISIISEKPDYSQYRKDGG